MRGLLLDGIIVEDIFVEAIVAEGIVVQEIEVVSGPSIALAVICVLACVLMYAA